MCWSCSVTESVWPRVKCGDPEVLSRVCGRIFVSSPSPYCVMERTREEKMSHNKGVELWRDDREPSEGSYVKGAPGHEAFFQDGKVERKKTLYGCIPLPHLSSVFPGTGWASSCEGHWSLFWFVWVVLTLVASLSCFVGLLGKLGRRITSYERGWICCLRCPLQPSESACVGLNAPLCWAPVFAAGLVHVAELTVSSSARGELAS